MSAEDGAIHRRFFKAAIVTTLTAGARGKNWIRNDMQTSKRRFDSLIPLSREHHYALMLCLRINRGPNDPNWIRLQAHKAVQFFDSDLVSHFQAEESVLFPAMASMPQAVDLVTTLLKEHNELRAMARSLSGLDDLRKFASLLESHIRKEERELFPIYEQQASALLDADVREKIRELIGDAQQPNHPELLD